MELLDFALKNAKEKPYGLAIQFQQTELNWTEFTQTYKQVASFLRNKGVKSGQLVGITGFSAIMQATLLPAIWHEACVSAILPIGYFRKPFLDPEWVITPEPIEGFSRGRQIVIDSLVMEKLELYPGNITAKQFGSAKSICHLMFSSGTTGTTKAIPYSLERVINRARVTSSKWRTDRPFLTSMGFRSASGFNTFAESILSGNPYLIAEGNEQVIKMIDRHKVQTLLCSPHDAALMAQRLEKESPDRISLKTIQTTGSLLPNKTRDRLQDLTGARFMNMYGSSEIGFVAIGQPGDSDTGYVGEILEDIEVEVLDGDGHVQLEGTTGELRMRRADQPTSLFGDYYDSQSVFKDGWYYPGDIGYIQGSQLFVVGRTNELLNAGGAKVLATELEAAIIEFEGIQDVAATMTTKPDGIPKIIALYCSEREVNSALISSEISAHFGERAPAVYRKVSSIPRNANGKIVRSRLEELDS